MDQRHQTDLLRLAFPIILGNLSQMALNLIDTAMVGHLSYHYLAAASLANNLVGIPYVLCIGFTAAISPLVAELKGAHAFRSCGALLNNAFYLNLVISFIVALGLYLCSDVVHYLRQDDHVAHLAQSYLHWVLWSIIPMIAFLSIKQFCDGLSHTQVPMILSLVSIPLNAFLNYLFIYGKWGLPALELTGAGIATFITRVAIAVALGAYVLYHSRYQPYFLQARKIQKSILKKVAGIALPSSWQHTSEVGAFVVLGIMVGWFGPLQQAAHQVSLSVAALTFMVSIGLSTAGSIKVGEAFGQQDPVLMRKTGLSVFKFAFLYGSLCAICFILFRKQIPLLFSNEVEVIRQASVLFLFAAAFQLGDSIQAVGIGVLRGLQDVRLPTLYTTLSYWFLGIPVGYFLSVPLNWQVSGIWVGFIVCLSTMAVLLYRRFLHITANHQDNTPG